MAIEDKLDEVKTIKARIPLKTVFTTTPAERKKYIQDVKRYNKQLIAERKAKLAELAKQKIYADDIKSALEEYERSELEARGAFLESLKDFEEKSGQESQVVNEKIGGMSTGTGQGILDYLKSISKVSKPTVSSSSSSRSSSSRKTTSSKTSGPVYTKTDSLGQKQSTQYAPKKTGTSVFAPKSNA